MGPVFRRVINLAASGTARPLQDESWIYRVLAFDAVVRTTLEATTDDVVATFSSGSDIQLGPDDAVQGGATIGVFNNDVNFADEFLGAAGDELNLVLRETGALTADVNVLIRLEPI